MSNHTTLSTLFATLHGSLPYEYDEKYLDTGTTASILISKSDSNHIMQIATCDHDDDVLTAFSYDDGDDPDEASETFQWDLDSPDVTLDTIITDIKNHF